MVDLVGRYFDFKRDCGEARGCHDVVTVWRETTAVDMYSMVRPAAPGSVRWPAWSENPPRAYSVSTAFQRITPNLGIYDCAE
jgi:hypothetical protein